MLGQEERLHEYKRAAAAAFIRANGINRIVYSGGHNPKIGIITVGKSYLDVRQALDDLGIDEAARRPTRRAAVQGRLPVAARRRASQGVRARPRDDHRRRGKALADRGAGARGPLRHLDAAAGGRQEGRARRLAVPGQGRARPQRHRHRRRRAHPARHRPGRRHCGARRAHPPVPGDARRHQGHRHAARRSSARAARTTARPRCRKARSPAPASAAISWRCGWTATPSASPRWAARARNGSGRRRSRRASTSSRTSATAPTTIPACWRCASRAAPASTSPTRSCSTTPSR